MIFLLADLPCALSALLMGFFSRFEDNLWALRAMLLVTAAFMGIVIVSTLAFEAHLFSGVVWQYMVSFGTYGAFTVISSGGLWDRLVAASGSSGTCTFLVYTADLTGCVGTITLLCIQIFGKSAIGSNIQSDEAVLSFFVRSVYVLGGAIICLLAASCWYFSAKLAWNAAVAPG